MESTPKGRPIETDAESPSPTSALDVRLAALRAIAELRHPHLAAVRGAPAGPGFELEAPAGIALIDLLDSAEGALDLRMRIRILLDALSGLAALHRAKVDGKPIGFVHGEVAPHNIVVARDGVGRLVPLVESHWSNPPVPASASLGYVAPERLLGDVFDQRADVFSIGVLVWEAIAGRRLFENLRMDAIVTQLVGGKVSRPASIPDAPWADALADVAMQALAVDPADRWPHVGVMGAEIETITEGCLASSDEIALLLRQRSGERPSYEAINDRPTYEAERQRYGSVMPAATPAPADIARGPVPPGDPRPERSSVVPGSMPRSAAPGGLIVWHGPQSVRPSGPKRESLRPSSPPPTSRGRRPSRQVVQRQSRIVWTAVGVGLALFAIAAYEMADRDAPSSNAGAPPSALRSLVPPVPPALDPPAPAKVVAPRTTAASEIASARALPLVDAGRTATRTSMPAVPSPPRNPAPPRAAVAPAPPPVPPPVVTAALPSEPPPPPAEPPAPKAKEDPFGI